MKFFAILCIFLLPVTIFGQETPEIKYYSSPLQVGEFILFGEKSIRFKEVISDSRCPKNVTCIRAGEAKVLVEVFENGKFLEEKIISTAASFVPLKFSVEDILYGISSINLLPYPTIENKNSRQDYTLFINVSEKL